MGEHQTIVDEWQAGVSYLYRTRVSDENGRSRLRVTCPAEARPERRAREAHRHRVRVRVVFRYLYRGAFTFTPTSVGMGRDGGGDVTKSLITSNESHLNVWYVSRGVQAACAAVARAPHAKASRRDTHGPSSLVIATNYYFLYRSFLSSVFFSLVLWSPPLPSAGASPDGASPSPVCPNSFRRLMSTRYT